MRYGINNNNKELCIMQTAKQFLSWYLDKDNILKSNTEIDNAEIKKKIFALPKSEQERLRLALAQR
jgi:hypothetical protein